MVAVTYRCLIDPDDRDLVSGFYQRSADYIWLETGRPPDQGTTEAYFTGAAPGHDCRGDWREGLFRGSTLDGIAELAFDLPQRARATLTLMILAPEARGQGHGAAWLDRLSQLARQRGAAELCLSVLGCNPRAQAFWQQCGFVPDAAAPPRRSGPRQHLRHSLIRTLA